jgi:hypothetical protein
MNLFSKEVLLKYQECDRLHRCLVTPLYPCPSPKKVPINTDGKQGFNPLAFSYSPCGALADPFLYNKVQGNHGVRGKLLARHADSKRSGLSSETRASKPPFHINHAMLTYFFFS